MLRPSSRGHVGKIVTSISGGTREVQYMFPYMTRIGVVLRISGVTQENIVMANLPVVCL